MEKINRVCQKACVKVIRCYQLFISPIIRPNCRFYPSCSQYGQAAIQKHGVFYGSWLTLKRIVRCHPFSAGGHDPV